MLTVLHTYHLCECGPTSPMASLACAGTSQSRPWRLSLNLPAQFSKLDSQALRHFEEAPERKEPQPTSRGGTLLVTEAKKEKLNR